MTELTVTEEHTTTCPPWCVVEESASGPHTHASADARVETLDQPLTVQLVQLADAEPHVLVDGQLATLEQATHFVTALRRLTDAATLAAPGLSFVVQLAARSGTTLEEMALAVGLDVERLCVQRAGAQVLSVAEVDRLALAVARLAAHTAS